MDPEERELTILITKLNANLQIQLTQTVGLAALSIASFVASYQSGIPSYVSHFLFIFAIFWMFAAIVLQRQLRKTTAKIRNLK
jgi:hypothetical protein